MQPIFISLFLKTNNFNIMKIENIKKTKYQSISKGLGITGLVLGILTLLISFIPLFGLFAIFFGIIAVSISLIGLVIALKHNHEKGLIIGVLIFSLLGSGIAYSQYAALNSITKEFVKEVNKDKTENKEKKVTSSRDTDVALVLEHIKKSEINVTDENGLPLNYEYKVSVIETKPLGKTKVISSIPNTDKGRDGYMNSMYAELSVSKIKIKLLINGKQIKGVDFVTHNYEKSQTNPFLDYYNSSKFFKKSFSYTPGLDDKSVLDEALKTFTKPNYYRDFIGRKKEEDSKYENKYINATSNLIKSSNILNIKTIEDFQKVKATIKEEKKKVDNAKKKEITVKETTNYKKLLITVDNLRVRTSPDLDAEKIENLALNTVVEFLDKKSENKTEVTIQGNKINEYWYQIKTSSGNIGWIHGCCFEEK
ncbi:SH3 domain-containing protein [Polaribacter ponticola]|uniref:SH3 domain-containing protein n=1 Tax=Polaribacter ponticola TaxID=2978475 RepID=A0ABT5SC23_9FLAO|nr:SH3 domain-containing protein [Polaribacter sp. MSW5]MDD7915364.1 SH3 domain-containing protein [Polaribacter sp. MSW5]